MRDTHRLKEKYELSLDNRQIVSLTVASIVVLGGVFMLGVVVGKKLSLDQSDKPPADLLTALDQKTAALNSMNDDASLTFPDELTRKSPTVPSVAAPRPEPVKPEPKPAEVVMKPEPAKLEEPKLPDAKLPESPRPEPVATRTDDAGALAQAFARVQRPPAEAVANGAFTLQLSAYQERGEADRFAAGLRDKGYAPYIIEANVPNKGLWFRVRMGRFPTKEAASRYLEDFKRETSMNAIVTGT